MLRLILAAYALLLVLSSFAAAEDEVSSVRDRRYCEILVVRRTGLKLAGDVYSTFGLNDCPQAQWAAIDAAKLKKERKALAIVMNGPRHFLMDRITVERKPPPPVDIQGLEMHFLAVLQFPWRNLIERKPYTEHIVNRRTHFIFEAGEPVYELISSSGGVYVMQSYAEIVDPSLRMADLASLGSRLKLSRGWAFRTRVLSSPLTVIATGEARVVQDDLDNTYQFNPPQP
jgi:hypothetical protein